MDRQALWSTLRHLTFSFRWIVLGDFNAIRFPREKVGGTSLWPPHMNEFNQCLYSIELDDLRYSGCLLTWANKEDPSHFVNSKLDRVLVNEHWMKAFSCSSAHFPTARILDHSPTIMTFTPGLK